MTEVELLEKHSDLLLKVLRCFPDLHIAAVVAAAAREHGCREITCLDEFSRLLEKDGCIQCGDVVVTLKQAERYFPPCYFPCRDEDDLIRKVIMAAAYGRAQHDVERGLGGPSMQARESEDVSNG